MKAIKILLCEKYKPSSDQCSISTPPENVRKPLKSLSYRNQSIDLLWKSMDWFIDTGISVLKELTQSSKPVSLETKCN